MRTGRSTTGHIEDEDGENEDGENEEDSENEGGDSGRGRRAVFCSATKKDNVMVSVQLDVHCTYPETVLQVRTTSLLRGLPT